MKWGDKYAPEYVNKLYGMIERNLSRPFLLTCFTEDAEGIRDEVNIAELPSIGLPEGEPERGWLKLATFQKTLAGLEGEVLFLDVDVVIVGSLDDFFEYDAEFAICFDEKKKKQKIGNSSVYRFRIGEHTDILEYFQDNFRSVQNSVRNEQAYLSNCMNDKGILNFWPKAWCPSYKYHCMHKWPFSYFKDSFIPKGAKVLIFHGHPEPHEAINGITTKWYRPVRKTKWIEKYWRE